MNNLSITRIMLGSAALVSVALGVFVWHTQARLGDLDQRAVEQAALADAMLAMADARNFALQIQRAHTGVGASGSEAGLGAARTSLEGARTALTRLVAAAPALADTGASLAREIAALHEVGERMARAYLREGRAAGNALMQQPGIGLNDQAARLAQRLDGEVQRLARELESSTRGLGDAAARARWTALALSGALLLLVGLATLALYRKVVPPLRLLGASLRDVAEGARDLTVSLDVRGHDETAAVAASFNRFVSTIRAIVAEAADSAARLGASGQAMRGASEEARGGLDRLQQETEQVATAMTQMATTIQEVAHHARGAAEAAEHADGAARRGQGVVEESVAVIRALAGEVEAAAAVIHRLESHSENIGSILDVIRGIAEQTNLLALNAAIEAARAGEQGRGFAVVAGEVRTLASRTQESTQQIQAMIERLQGGASEAVKVMEDGRARAEASVQRAEDIGESLAGITRAVAQISDMNVQIAGAAEQQSVTAADINRNVDNIFQAATAAAESAERTAETSAEMSDRIAELARLMGQFRVA